MKYETSIVAVIAVAAVAALGINTYSDMTSPSSNGFAGTALAMGHVEMVLTDANGNVKGYFQGDNVVTDAGDACTSEKIFGDATNSTECAGVGAGNYFDKIGIINGTFSPSDATTNTGHYVAATDANDGLMAITQGAATVPDSASSQGTATTITNSAHVFNFDGSNDTTVSGVILIDALCSENADGSCGTIPASAGVFAARTATLSTSDGDSLTVTWTITIGDSN